jgi:hypothetical protein
MLKQCLEDEIKFAHKDMAQAKQDSSAATQSNATGEGDLESTTATLKKDEIAKADLEQDCSVKAEDFEAETTSRAEGLRALADAKKVIAEASGEADALTSLVQEPSFLQVSSGSAHAFEGARFVRGLAKKKGSASLAQLASRIGAALSSTSGEAPFAMISGLISDLIAKLEDEAGADAAEKAFCDKELAESTAKEDEL